MQSYPGNYPVRVEGGGPAKPVLQASATAKEPPSVLLSVISYFAGLRIS